MYSYESIPRDDRYVMPAEFSEHESTWMLWPERTDIWRLGAKPAQKTFSLIANTIAKYEKITVGVTASQYENARTVLSPEIQVIELSYDDAWVRDNGPSFLVGKNGALRGVDWFFNAWGGIGGVVNNGWNLQGSYFPWKLDDMVARKILEIERAGRYRCPLLVEGGAFHVDGNGTLLAVSECVWGRNRNLTTTQIEEILCGYLGVSNIIWLQRGLYLEENNGHIDNMCCFADAQTILLNWCDDKSDPQFEISSEAYDILSRSTNANGKPYKIVKVSQPPAIHIVDEESDGIDASEYAIPRLTGDRLPATYINSYILNNAVLVPSFSSNYDDKPHQYDEKAFRIYSEVFQDRQIIQIPSRELLLGGGGVHCILQQVPKHKNI